MWWVALPLVSVFVRRWVILWVVLVPLGRGRSPSGCFFCLLVGVTYLLNRLGCSLGDLVCFFTDPVWFLLGSVRMAAASCVEGVCEKLSVF